MTAKSASGGIKHRDLLAARHHHRLLPLDSLRILEPRPASPRNVLPVLCLRQCGVYGDCLGVALIPSNPMGFNPVEIHGLRAGTNRPPPFLYPIGVATRPQTLLSPLGRSLSGIANVDALNISPPMCSKTLHFSTGYVERGRIRYLQLWALWACVCCSATRSKITPTALPDTP
jgi:hypothetical protein